MTVPISSSSPAGVADAETEAVVHPRVGGEATGVRATPRRLEWVLVIAVLAVALGMTVALLVTLWLRPGSGSVGP